MFAVTSSTFATSAAAGLTVPRNARHCRRAAASLRVVRASAEGETKSETPAAVSDEVKAASDEWAENEKAAAPAEKSFFAAAIDPADGSIAEAAPLGDDLSMLTSAMVAFKEPRATEIINGRVAMIGWMLALQGEFTSDQSLFRQVINTRTFTLADGVVKSSTFPAPGMFLIPVTVLLVLAASLAPVLRGNEESGLEKAPKDFFMFRAESEMTNGRGAMIGLVALLFAEKFTNGAALF
jgi:hypothetical protein